MNLNFEHIVVTSKHKGWHLLFWVFVSVFYTLFFGHQNANYASSLFFVALLLPITITTLYFLNYFLIPRFLLQKKYPQFLLFLFYTSVISSWIQLMLIVFTFFTLAQYKSANMSPASLDLYFLVVSMYLVVIIGVAIKLFKHWYQTQQKNQFLLQDKLEAELRVKKAELQLLKAQIHPHFLFNTLNSLYGLTLEKSDLAPEVVIKLSELLDYLLYRCSQPSVLLKDEIKHIENFIALEQLRYENKLNLEFNTEGNIQHQSIAPMLILPFVENCFKHGVSNNLHQCWIHIHLQVDVHQMLLEIQNSKVQDIKPLRRKEGKGIGLENVKKRLSFLYKDQHELSIRDTADKFSIHLQLDFKA